MKKLFLFLLIIAFLGCGVFFGARFFQKYSDSQGSVKVRIHPAEAILKIGDESYQNKQGVFQISLPAGEYEISFSCPDYSLWENEIAIQSGEINDLGEVYLFPNDWPKEIIVAQEDIELMRLSPDSNRIVYIVKESSRVYRWYVFDRRTKEKKSFYQSSALPQEIIFSAKKILVHAADNDWKIVFWPESLVEDSISINRSFQKELTESGLKEKNASLSITQAGFPDGGDDGDLIIQTADALYLLNFLTESITKIHAGASSPFHQSNGLLYLINESGILTKIAIASREETSVSSYGFAADDLKNMQIQTGKTGLLIVDAAQNAYYLPAKADMPKFIGEKTNLGMFSNDGKKILLYSPDQIEIYDTETEIQYTSKIFSDAAAVWFLNNDYILAVNDGLLNIYYLHHDKNWPVAGNVKNNNFFYDPSVNYIFYLSSSGILKISI